MRVPVVAGTVVMIVVLAACTFASEPDDIADALGIPTSIVDLAEVVPGPWERAYVFGEYETADTIQNALCFVWGDAARAASFTKADGFYVIAFTTTDSVTDWVTVNARYAPGDAAVAFDQEPPFYVERQGATFSARDGIAGSRTLSAVRPMPTCP